MIVLFLLIPLSILTAGVFLAGFIWAVRSGQFEDTCTPALRLLSDESKGAKKGEPQTFQGNVTPTADGEGTQILRKE